MLEDGEEPVEKLFLVEVWAEARPYVKIFFRDGLIVAVAWIVFFVFIKLTAALPVHSFAGRYVEYAHGAGMVGAFVLLGVLFIRSIWAEGKRHK